MFGKLPAMRSIAANPATTGRGFISDSQPSTSSMSTTTARRYVCQLGHNEQISQVFLASEKQLRPNRNGNLYLQLQLSDRSGAISTRLWNASENDYRAFENGDFVKIDGNTQLFQGNMQLIASSIRRARPDEVDEAEFLVLRSDEIDHMATRLAEILRT